MKYRKALVTEFDEIYRMGFDAWADEMTEGQYMEACRNSTKYQKGQFYVLTNPQGPLLSSLIIYPFTEFSYGIGSLATPPSLRKQGFASALLKDVLRELDLRKVQQVFLYADIAPEFYERFGFQMLPLELQTKEFSICMVRTNHFSELIENKDFLPPRYF